MDKFSPFIFVHTKYYYWKIDDFCDEKIFWINSTKWNQHLKIYKFYPAKLPYNHFNRGCKNIYKLIQE